jgi:hypothetical protein
VVPEGERPLGGHCGPLGEDREVERTLELAVGIDDIDEQRSWIADERLGRRRDPVVLFPARHYSSAA